jgi:SAM-dependent methyltransferase
MRTVISKLPEWAKKPLRRIRYYGRSIPSHGKGRFCPVCGKSSRRFAQFGFVPREEAQCVYCGALERHRLLWLFVTKKTDIFGCTSKKMLHVAAEPCLESNFRQRIGQNYLTADLFKPAMVKMDVTDIQYANESFDAIICSHVLEYIQDDRRAMREFYRVLKNDGWAILLVPITSDKTLEGPSIAEPDERRRYGQTDYVDRLRKAGFSVDVTKVSDLVDGEEAVEMGLTPHSGEIYYCTKQFS